MDDKKALPAERPPGLVPEEIEPLAMELHHAYKRIVRYYQETQGINPEDPEHGYPLKDADRLARECPPQVSQRVLEESAEDISWWELSRLAEHEPDLALESWRRVKSTAQDELVSGHRAAKTVEGAQNKPFDRARFLAVRQSLIDDWQPRGGVELMLIDQLAQARHQEMFWMERLVTRSTFDAAMDEGGIDERGEWYPTRIRTKDAVDQAAAMVDRFNRVVMRTLRSLRDLRRYAPVVIGRADQVNIAAQGGQQVNVAGNVVPGTPEHNVIDASET